MSVFTSIIQDTLHSLHQGALYTLGKIWAIWLGGTAIGFSTLMIILFAGHVDDPGALAIALGGWAFVVLALLESIEKSATFVFSGLMAVITAAAVGAAGAMVGAAPGSLVYVWMLTGFMATLSMMLSMEFLCFTIWSLNRAVDTLFKQAPRKGTPNE
jgi:hypothetical protein